MKKVLIISKEFYLDLYRPGIDDYVNSRDDLAVDMYCLDNPKINLGLIDGLKYKFDINDFRRKYYEEQRTELLKLIEKYDVILFINLYYDGEFFIQGKLFDALRKKHCKLQFVDSITTFPSPIPFLDIFKEIYVFETQDRDILENQYKINPIFVTGGTSYYLYNDIISGEKEKKYDVCFVGNASPKRIDYLNAIAKWCDDNSKKLIVIGHYWHNNNWINSYLGEKKFKRKYPILYKYVQNKFVDPSIVAALYVQSKIVLNINHVYHKNFNQRTYDIIYTGALLMMDKQEIGESLIVPNRDFIMCDDESDMVEKIEVYLRYEEKLNEVASNGKRIVEELYLYKHTLSTVFQDI